MLMATAWVLSTVVNALDVNWAPWSVLKIAGGPSRVSASARASTQKSLSEGVRHPPGQDAARVPIQDSHQIHEPVRHRDVADIGYPHLIRSLDGQAPQQVRIHRVSDPGLARARLRIQGAQAHLAHQALDSLAIHRGPLGLELVSKAATAVERTLSVDLVQEAHQGQVLR